MEKRIYATGFNSKNEPLTVFEYYDKDKISQGIFLQIGENLFEYGDRESAMGTFKAFAK